MPEPRRQRMQAIDSVIIENISRTENAGRDVGCEIQDRLDIDIGCRAAKRDLRQNTDLASTVGSTSDRYGRQLLTVDPHGCGNEAVPAGEIACRTGT